MYILFLYLKVYLEFLFWKSINMSLLQSLSIITVKINGLLCRQLHVSYSSKYGEILTRTSHPSNNINVTAVIQIDLHRLG